MKTREQLFEENMKIAYKVAHNFIQKLNLYNEEEDVFQEALIGLWKATESYDESKKIKFSTFAYKYCTTALYNISVTSSTKNEREKMKRNDKPFVKVSMEDKVPGSEKLKFKNSIVQKYTYDTIDDTVLNTDTEYFMNNFLTDKEKEILTLKLNDMNGNEIATKLEMTPQRVSNIMKQIRKKWGRWYDKKEKSSYGE